MPQRGRAIIYSVVVFAAGMIAGALLMNLGEHLYLHPAGRARELSPWEQADRSRYIETFKTELNLTDVQVRQVEDILDETGRQYHDLHSFSHHIRQQGIIRIRGILDEQQRRRFEQIVNKAPGHEVGQKKDAGPAQKASEKADERKPGR